MIKVKVTVTEDNNEKYSGEFDIIKDVSTIDDVDAMLYTARRRIKQTLHEMGVYPNDAQT